MAVLSADDTMVYPMPDPMDELGRLGDDTAELSLLAEDTFKNAAAALYVPDSGAARGVADAAEDCTRLFYALNQRALSILALATPSSDTMRRVVELQHVAAEFARIGDHCREIAEQALALAGSAEDDLSVLGSDAPNLLIQMLRQTYIEVRACVVATTTRDTAMARRIISEDGELQRLYLLYKGMLERSIALNPRNAARLSRLLLVGVQLHNIGSRVVAVARTILFTPPQLEH